MSGTPIFAQIFVDHRVSIIPPAPPSLTVLPNRPPLTIPQMQTHNLNGVSESCRARWTGPIYCEFLGTFAASMGPDNYVDAGRSVCHAFQEEPPSLLPSSILCSAEALVFSWPWILVQALNGRVNQWWLPGHVRRCEEVNKWRVISLLFWRLYSLFNCISIHLHSSRWCYIALHLKVFHLFTHIYTDIYTQS